MFAKLVRAFAVLAFVAFSFALGPSAEAQSRGRVRVLCPEAALNVPLYEKVIAQKVKESVDLSAFKEVRVRVGLRRVGGESEVRSNSFDEVLSGLSLSNQGLTVLASGSLSFDLRCSHIYIARIRVTATDLDTNVRFSSSTDSRLTINSAGEAALKRLR